MAAGEGWALLREALDLDVSPLPGHLVIIVIDPTTDKYRAASFAGECADDPPAAAHVLGALTREVVAP